MITMGGTPAVARRCVTGCSASAAPPRRRAAGGGGGDSGPGRPALWRPLRQSPPRCQPASNFAAEADSKSHSEAEAEGEAGAAAAVDGDGGAAAAGGAGFSPPHFSDFPLDRAGHLRREPQQLAALLAYPDTRVLLLHAGKLLVAPPTAPPTAAGALPPPFLASSFAPAGATAPDGEAPAWVPVLAPALGLLEAAQGQLAPEQLLFLGLRQGGAASKGACDAAGAVEAGAAAEAGATAAAVFAVELPELLLPELGLTAGEAGATGAALGGAAWVDVRGEGQRMAGPDAGVAALVAGMASWHRANPFCARSGASLAPTSGGHARATPAAAAAPPASSSSGGGSGGRDSSSGSSSQRSTNGNSSSSGGGRARRVRPVYPRIDPAVIAAVGCGDWLLLGRKATWAPGRYSCLAGFAEVGEALEQAVAREVFEEAGVHVDLSSVQYRGSQPWPFPQSLMVGFVAEAAAAQQAGSRPAPGSSGLEVLASPQALAAAREVGLRADEAERYLLPALPPLQVDAKELESALWFHAEWLAAATGLGSSSSSGDSGSSGGGSSGNSSSSSGGGFDVWRGSGGSGGAGFRIPGRYALANTLIGGWLEGRGQQQQQGGQQSEAGAAAAAALAAVPDVHIDEGTFKYVLLRLSTADGATSKLLVRGDNRAAYHNHIYQQAAVEARAAVAATGVQLTLETVGGGRMEHHPQQQLLTVYGYSAAFGQAPHDVTAALLRRWLPMHTVEVSYEGY